MPPEIFHTGKKDGDLLYRSEENRLRTMIYRNGESSPCAWVPGNPELAARIASLLNRERPQVKAEHVAGARYEPLLATQAKALQAQADTITELEREREALCRALYRESSDNLTLRAGLVEKAQELQEQNERLTEENALLSGEAPFPVAQVIAENASLKRALAEHATEKALATEPDANTAAALRNLFDSVQATREG